VEIVIDRNSNKKGEKIEKNLMKKEDDKVIEEDDAYIYNIKQSALLMLYRWI
jgi:hypothetical protein